MAQKSALQLNVELVLKVFGVLFLATDIYGSISNTFSLINPRSVLFILTALMVIYPILHLVYGVKPLWVTNSGKSITTRKLFKPTMVFVGILVVLTLIKLVIFPPAVKEPVFSSKDKRTKVLVLPFDKECDFQGARYDIGKVVSKRLQALNQNDTLNLAIHYLTDSINFSNFTQVAADSIMKYHNADQIIYGSYSLRQCEGNITDKVCFNYRINPNRWNLGSRQYNTDYKMQDLSGLEALRKGSGQEDIDFIIYTTAGVTSLYNQKYRRALTQFRKIKEYENDPGILQNLAICYNYLNQPMEAKKILEKVISSNPKDDLAWNNLGAVYVNMNEHEKSKECYETAIKLNPKKYLQWHNLARFYRDRKDYTNSIKSLENAVRNIPKHPFLWAHLGSDYYVQGNLEKAELCFKRALKIYPVDGKAWSQLGFIYKSQEKYSLADQCWNKAMFYFKRDIKEYPDRDEPLLNFAFFYLDQKQYETAISYFMMAAKINPQNDKTWAFLSECHMVLNDLPNVKKYSEQSLKINPNNPQALSNLGGYYFETHHHIEAVVFYKRAIEINPFTDTYWVNLGNAYFMVGDSRARECYRNALKLNSEAAVPALFRPKSQLKDQSTFKLGHF